MTVTLGISGTMATLTRLEDGSWTLLGEAFASGGTTDAANGNAYALTMGEDGTWSAAFVPVEMEIKGTGLTALTREDQMGYDVNGDTVPASGAGDVTVSGASYHVWKDDGMLMGARFDAAIHGDSDGDGEAFVLVGDFTTAADRPLLAEDDEDTVANELRTTLSIGGATFSVADLLGAGSASASGDSFVAAAVGEIEKARADVAALLGLSEAPDNLATAAPSTGPDTSLLGTNWAKVQTELDKLFGAGEVDLGNKPHQDDILGEIDDILEALSSGTSLAAASAEDGGGVFESLALSEADALAAFDAAASESGIVFGSTGPTRYGAVSVTERENAVSDLDYHWGTMLGTETNDDEKGAVGAFSYSTIDDVQRVWDIIHTGSAYYEGGTTAVSGTGVLYTGDIAVQVRFSSERVSGLVTNLRSAEGDAWTYQYGEVESIVLPTAENLSPNAHWSIASGNNTDQAQVTFERRAGSPQPQSVDATFQGQLLGRGDDSGSHAHGTWSVGEQSESGTATYLAGSFGAERVEDVGPTRPGTDDGSTVETLVTSNYGLDDNKWPNAFSVSDGELTVTMSKGGRTLDTTGTQTIGTAPDTREVLGATAVGKDGFEVAATDPPTVDLKVELTKLLASSGSDVNTNGPNKQVQLVVETLETLRGDLAVLQALDTRIPTSEAAAWEKVQAAFLRIFHHVPPKLADAYDEDDALGLIDQALNAFSSSANLKVALDPDGTGIFNNVTKADGTTAPSHSLIWGRQEVQMKARLSGTDYTRYGGWRVRADRYAARDAWTNYNLGDDSGNDPGLFAYSPLLPTKWQDQDDPGYPGGGSATFMGGTVALQGTVFHEGDVEVLAEWEQAWSGGKLGALTMTISNLADSDGDPVATAGGVAIETITFPGIDITHDEDSDEIVFINTKADIRLASAPLGTSVVINTDANTIKGKFVGQDVEGPLGVIGTWSVHTAAVTGATIHGAFGAERP